MGYTLEVTMKAIGEETRSNVKHAIFLLELNKKMRNSAKCRFLVRCGRYIGPLQGGLMYGKGESLLDKRLALSIPGHKVLGV